MTVDQSRRGPARGQTRAPLPSLSSGEKRTTGATLSVRPRRGARAVMAGTLCRNARGLSSEPIPPAGGSRSREILRVSLRRVSWRCPTCDGRDRDRSRDRPRLSCRTTRLVVLFDAQAEACSRREREGGRSGGEERRRGLYTGGGPSGGSSGGHAAAARERRRPSRPQNENNAA